METQLSVDRLLEMKYEICNVWRKQREIKEDFSFFNSFPIKLQLSNYAKRIKTYYVYIVCISDM